MASAVSKDNTSQFLESFLLWLFRIQEYTTTLPETTGTGWKGTPCCNLFGVGRIAIQTFQKCNCLKKSQLADLWKFTQIYTGSSTFYGYENFPHEASQGAVSLV